MHSDSSRTRWFGALVACIACVGEGAAKVAPTRRFDAERFSVSVPSAWRVAVFRSQSFIDGRPTPGGRPMVSGVRFEGPDGDFLVVHDNEFGLTMMPEADAWWRIRLAQDGSVSDVITSPSCSMTALVPEDPPCLAGDGRLDVIANVSGGGTDFELRFGNTRRERAEDLRAFEAILRTLLVRSTPSGQ